MRRRSFLKTAALGATGMSLYTLYAAEPRLERFRGMRYAVQPEGEIPVIAEVDIFVAGATLGGVAASVSAARSGSTVFVAGYSPYPGEDICGNYKYLFGNEDLQEGEHDSKLFAAGKPPTPMYVKTLLEKDLIENDIDFLYCSYVTDIVFGDDDLPAGVVLSNRSGRQAVLCSCIIDCTSGAWVARLAGAVFNRLHNGGDFSFKYITIGNRAGADGTGGSSRFPAGAKVKGVEYPAVEHNISIQLDDFSFPSIASAEQSARDMTWDADQVDSADRLIFNMPLRLRGRRSAGESARRIADIPVEAFIPENIDNLFVQGSCADLPANIISMLEGPSAQMALGKIIGKAASESASGRQKGSGFYTRAIKGTEYLKGVTGEISEIIRPNLGTGKIFSQKSALPVLGEFDIVVAGGGTAGAPAAISAARNGARVLVTEYLHGLGGTGTLGLIGRYWYGHREGFTSEIDRGVREMAPASHPRQKTRGDEWVVDWKMEWYRREIRKAGGEIWFGVIVSGALVDNGRVKGVVVSTPEGMGVVLAGQVIDATGSADVAIAAGAGYEYTGSETVAVQGSGLPKSEPGDHYNNTDWTFIDDSDVFDVTRVFISGRQKFQSAWDTGKLPQTRERRRVRAEYMVSPIDMMNGRRYSDTISYHVSNFDTHGYTVHPYFIIKQPAGGHITYDVDLPLRCLLPVGLEGIIVTGLGAGAHRDAMPVIRMQPCLQNQGYAVGYLAAMLVKEGIPARKTDMKKIQRHLVSIGNLPERVLTEGESIPFTERDISNAVTRIGNDFEGLEVLFSDIVTGKGYLEKALKRSDDHKEKLNIAIALGVLGNDSGWEILADEVRLADGWDEGWNFTGMHQFGHSLSRLDIIIIALGRCKREEVTGPVIHMAEMLDPESHFSHFRAVSVALETVANKAAAPVLFNLLKMQGVTGHHVISKTDAVRATVPSHIDVTLRNNVLREMHLARALYRCGDHYGLGKQILENYANDLHGHYFRHATGVLGRGFNVFGTQL